MELVVKYVYKYPNYVKGTRYFVQNPLGSSALKRLTWRPPGFKIMNVEGGNIVVKLNNLGFPGIDVKLTKKTKFIHVMGSSFVEALQVVPQKCATSILQQKLKIQDENLEVLNLGYSSNDTFNSWFRSYFFSQYYKPEYILVVLESQSYEWLNRYTSPLEFDLSSHFGEEIKERGLKKIVREVGNYSAFLNLITEGIRIQMSRMKKRNSGIKNETKKTEQREDELNPKLLQALSEYKEICPNIVVVSIIPSIDINFQLNQFCIEEGIFFSADENILTQKNRLSHGLGHLNEAGNKELGILLYDVLMKGLYKDKR